MTTIMDKAINSTTIRNFNKWLDKIEVKGSLDKVGDGVWREYCFEMGQVVKIILKQLEEMEEK